MELTLTHEEIYVYIEEIKEQTYTTTATSSCTLVNDSTNMIADSGIIEIIIDSGSFSAIKLTGSDGRIINVKRSLIVGSKITLDLRNMIGYIGDDVILFDNYITFEDNNNSNSLTLNLTGSGSFTVNYTRKQVARKIEGGDLMFCEGMDISTELQHTSTTDIHGKEKVFESDKKTYSWSINGLWNRNSFNSFKTDSGEFSIRTMSEEGNDLEYLYNCTISSVSKSSSSSGDYTYNISGKCLKIVSV